MADTSRQKLIEYFKKNLKKGYTIDSLKWALIRQGYSRAMIDASAKRAQQELAETAPVLKEKPIIKYHVVDESNKEIPVKLKKSWWKKFSEIF